MEYNIKDSQDFGVICPFCVMKHIYKLKDNDSNNSLTCKNCNKNFDLKLVTIKKKSSKGYKKQNQRNYSIRVLEENGTENLIDFVTPYNLEIELRNKDKAIFTYLNNKLIMIHNLNIDRYTKLNSISTCFIATHIFGKDSYEVFLLRNYRDKKLIPNFFFRILVIMYYYLSPKLIKYLGSNKIFNFLCFIALSKMLKIISIDYQIKITEPKTTHMNKHAQE